MSLLNIGIIGPGRVAERHASALKGMANAQLWSVAGRTSDSARRFADKYQTFASAKAFDDIEIMLQDPHLNAVIIATPDKLHAEHITLALHAGKAILVEKPACTSLKSGQEILKISEELQLLLGVAYHLRWHGGVRKVAAMVHEHKLGKIHHMRMHWAVNFMDHAKWRIDENYSQWCCLTTLGTHLIDIMRWLMVPVCGEVIDIKSIVKNTPLNANFDETIVAIFCFASGATCEIYCSMAFDSPFQLEIHGDKTLIGIDLVGQHRKIFMDNEPLLFNSNNPYVDQLNDFFQSVIEKKSPEVDFREGLKNVEHLISIQNAVTH